MDLDNGDHIGLWIRVGLERQQAGFAWLDGGVDLVGEPRLELLELARLDLVRSDEDEWRSHDGLLGNFHARPSG